MAEKKKLPARSAALAGLTNILTDNPIANMLGKRPAPKGQNRVKLLVSIVNKRDMARLKEVIDECSVSLSVDFPGLGTAHSQVLDYLGIGETEKTVALSLIPESDEPGRPAPSARRGGRRERAPAGRQSWRGKSGSSRAGERDDGSAS